MIIAHPDKGKAHKVGWHSYHKENGKNVIDIMSTLCGAHASQMIQVGEKEILPGGKCKNCFPPPV